MISRLKHFVTYVKGDFELAQKWYGAQGDYHECLMYPSNLHKDYAMPPKKSDVINIMVGNSADPSNNHLQAFEKLLPFKNQNVMIYCPLSYGPAEYANRIVEYGKDLFGNRFIPLLEFMAFEKYLELLGQIDVAVFAHDRQQAMGNTISLLGLGKKVFIRDNVTPWKMFEELGVKVYNFSKFDLEDIEENEKINNKLFVKKYFSEASLISQWKSIF